MLAAAAVRTSIHFKSLGISRLFPCFCPHVPQLPPVMAHIIMFIFKDFISHVVIFSDIFFIRTGFPLFMILKLNIAGNVISFQVQEVFLTAVAAVSRYFLQNLPKGIPVFFQNRDQSIIICAVIAWGEQLSISITVLFDNFLCFVSFRFRFSSITCRTFSIPSMINICAFPRSYLGPYPCSSKNGLLGKYQLESKDEKLNRMVNIWHQYQCMVTFNMSRSASYYETGTGRGMGFRDSCQDLFGFVHMVPERARERIIDIASIQLPDGSTYHQYQPLTKRGNNDIGGGFNDDPLWLVGAVCAYVKETGDFTILEHPTPFNNVEGSEQPLMEHIRRSIQFTRNHLGPHGLPLIGRADWNDCLNLNCFSEEPGESFQTFGPSEGSVAESVFIAGMFVKYGTEYAELCMRMGYEKEASEIREAVKNMERAILQDGWDGEWFLRAYDARGNKVGSHECTEGQIYIEPQGFCALAGVGKETGQMKKALPGFKENGSVFCHNNPWIVCGEAVLGRGNEAFDIYRRICPAYLEEQSEIHETEPYAYAQTVTGRASGNPGHAKNSWLTGTASWAFVSISQAILGICPEYDGLRITPCVPDGWKEFTVWRCFRGTQYVIHVLCTGNFSVTANGESIADCIVPNGWKMAFLYSYSVLERRRGGCQVFVLNSLGMVPITNFVVVSNTHRFVGICCIFRRKGVGKC